MRKARRKYILIIWNKGDISLCGGEGKEKGGGVIDCGSFLFMDARSPLMLGLQESGCEQKRQPLRSKTQEKETLALFIPSAIVHYNI